MLSGLQGLSAVLMALLRRTQTGLGDYIDISMHDAMMAACVNVLGPAIAEGRQPIAKQERTTGGSAFYRIYRTSDDRYVTLAGQEEKFVRNLLDAVGRSDLIDLCLQGPGPHQAPVIAFFAAMFRARPLAHWIEWLGSLDVCFGPVQTFPGDAGRSAIEGARHGGDRRQRAKAYRFRRSAFATNRRRSICACPPSARTPKPSHARAAQVGEPPWSRS